MNLKKIIISDILENLIGPIIFVILCMPLVIANFYYDCDWIQTITVYLCIVWLFFMAAESKEHFEDCHRQLDNSFDYKDIHWTALFCLIVTLLPLPIVGRVMGWW